MEVQANPEKLERLIAMMLGPAPAKPKRWWQNCHRPRHYTHETWGWDEGDEHA